MSRETELRAQRRVTAAFIDANPVTIALVPRERVKLATGARLVPGEERAPQTFRLIDQSGARGPSPGKVTTGDGTQRMVEFQLLGEHDAVVGLYDTWVDGTGVTYEVAELFPLNGYEVRAQVVRYAE